MKCIHMLIIYTILLSAPLLIGKEQSYYSDETHQTLENHNIIETNQDTQSAAVHDINSFELEYSELQKIRETIQKTTILIMHYIQSIEERARISEDDIHAIIKYRNEEQPYNSRKERIMAHVAKIVSGIFNIARDPHNAHNVGDSVGNMVQGIINITVDAIKDRKEKKLVRTHLEKACDEVTQEINLLLERCKSIQ